MTTTTSRDLASRRTTRAVFAMGAGLLLTLVATAAPFVDRATTHLLADHIRHGYPSYTAGEVDTAVTTWLVVLGVVGALGIACWVLSMWWVVSGKRFARSIATVGFVAGAAVGLAALLTPDTSGEVGLAPALGWLGLLPSLAGAVAVAELWRRGPRDR